MKEKDEKNISLGEFIARLIPLKDLEKLAEEGAKRCLDNSTENKSQK